MSKGVEGAKVFFLEELDPKKRGELLNKARQRRGIANLAGGDAPVEWISAARFERNLLDSEMGSQLSPEDIARTVGFYLGRGGYMRYHDVVRYASGKTTVGEVDAVIDAYAHTVAFNPRNGIARTIEHRDILLQRERDLAAGLRIAIQTPSPTPA